MAELRQTQLWDIDEGIYSLIPSSGRPQTQSITDASYRLSGIPAAQGITTNQNGAYVAGGDAWIRWQIVQPAGQETDFRFAPGSIIQVNTSPAGNTLSTTGARAIIVANSKITTGDLSTTYSIGGISYDTRRLNDVTILPLEGTVEQWRTMVGSNNPGENGTIRRIGKAVQEDYSNIIKYGRDIHLATDNREILIQDLVYSQGDGEDNNFMRDHNMVITDLARVRFLRSDINFGYPRTTNGNVPARNRNNWFHENSVSDDRPRYQATTRNFISAGPDADPDTFFRFIDRGGDVSFVGTDLINTANDTTSTFPSDQYMSFGREALEVVNGTGNAAIAVASQASGFEGYWSQSVTAGDGDPRPDLQDFLNSQNYFDFTLPTGTTYDVTREVQEAPVEIFYYGAVDANEGQAVVLTIPVGQMLPISRRGTFIYLDLRQVPGYVLPDFSLPVFVMDAANVTIADSNILFARPGRDQNFSSVLRFDDIPHVTDTNITFDNINEGSRVEIDGRTVALNAVPPYFDYCTINDSLVDPNASRSNFVIANAQASFNFDVYGLSARAVSIQPFEPDSGPPVLSSNDQRLTLIDPEFCVTKAYNPNEQNAGQVSILRTLRGTISNGKPSTADTSITLHQAGSNVVRYDISATTGAITQAANQPMTDDSILTRNDAVITLTDGDATYPPNTHPYSMLLTQYVMPSTNDTAFVPVTVQNDWRVAITEPGCIPEIITDLEVGARMQDASDVNTQLNPESTNARPRYDRTGINTANAPDGTRIAVGNISLERDTQFPSTFDFTPYQAQSDTNPLNTLFDLYTGIHLLASFRTDDNGSQAGNHLATVDYTTSSTGRVNYLTFAADPAGAISLSPEGQQTDVFTPGDMRVGYGKLSWDAPTRIVRFNSGRPSGEPTQVATPFTATPGDGRIDIRGISFQGTAGMIDAEGQSINCGMHNAVISNVAGTNGGTYEQVTFMMAPGDYTFNSANFAGNLADIVFVNTAGTTGGAVNIAFTGASGTTPNTGNFTTRGTVNFPDVRTFVFPTPGQVVISRPATTATGFEVLTIGGNTTNHVTSGSPENGYDLALPDNLVPIGTTVNVYYKPYDTVSTTPFGDSNRSRFHLVNVPVEWDTGRQNMSINIAGEVDYDIVRQLTPIEEQDMGTTQDDQYTPPTGRFAWDFYDGSATSTSPINGARLRINLHAPGATGVRTVLNEGQTKQFLYWMMERQDLNRTGRNHFIEAVAALGHPVNHEIDDNTALPIRLFESSAFIDTRTMTMAKFDETDPLNSFTGLGPVPFNPGRTGGPGQNAVYAIQRSDALNASGNRPGDNNDGDGTHENSRDLYLIDETRVEAGNIIRGLPDIDNQNPTDGLTETQVTQATTVAINNSQANNILHWHADGFSSKIPVGRTYNPNTDYSEN